MVCTNTRVCSGHIQPLRHQQGLHLLPDTSTGAHRAYRTSTWRSPQEAYLCAHRALQASRTHVT